MRRIGVLLALLLAVPAWSATAADNDDVARRPYRVHVPPGAAPAGGRPLVVYLHGCTQTAEDAAVGTRWDELADREGVIVVYPEQVPEANGTLCWNWFMPEHQVRGAGEPAFIVDVVARVMASFDVDESRVYVVGASAGADMATILGATYPDVFAAIAPLAGCAYATCSDGTGDLAYAAMATHARVLPVMPVQGTADPLNNPALGESAVRQWVGTNRLSSTPTSTEDHGDPTAVRPGEGDPCVRNGQFPCAAGVTGWESYPYTVHHYEDEHGCAIVDAWYVHGMSHDYPGGNTDGTFTDPAGPNITEAIWSFFERHRVGAPCGGTTAG